MPHRVLMVDDERLVRLGLAKLLAARDDVEIVGEADSVEQAAKEVQDKDPDVIFLDIQLLDGTGFELFERVRIRAHVIFLTAHVEFALRAFDVQAVDYLVKPVSAEKIARALTRVAEATTRSHIGFQSDQSREFEPRLSFDDRVALREDTQLRIARVKDIMFVRAAGDFSEVHLANGSVALVTQPVRLWESRLPEEFVRIHRSTIINLDLVERVVTQTGNWQVCLRGWPEAFVVSRRYTIALKSRLHALQVT